jgi:hypothetical protein
MIGMTLPISPPEIEIIDASENQGQTALESLRSQIIDGLRTASVQVAQEPGLPILEWTKSLPSRKTPRV